MSRSHLYRGTAPARPLLSIVLAALWIGMALAAVFGTAPDLLGPLPLHGPAAAALERLFSTVAMGAVLVGLLVAVRELLSGRTPLRTVRLCGAVLLALAGAFGGLDTARRILRPGTPATLQAQSVSAVPAADVEVAGVRGQRLLWTSLGLLGAAVVLVAGLAALRERHGPS